MRFYPINTYDGLEIFPTCTLYIHLLEKTQKVSKRKSAQMKENPPFPVKDIQILSLIVFSRQKKYL